MFYIYVRDQREVSGFPTARLELPAIDVFLIKVEITVRYKRYSTIELEEEVKRR